MAKNRLHIICGNASRDLARAVCKHLGQPLGNAEVSRYADGEVFVQVEDNVRGVDLFIVQSTYPPAEHVMELLLLIDACRRSSTARVTAVVPYFGYARADRKDQPRVAISAKLLANLITQAGAHRVLTVDLHSPQIQGFFDIPLDHLYAAPVLMQYFEGLEMHNVVVVAPDAGGVKMGRAFAKRLGVDLAIIDKRRVGHDKAELMNVIGDVEGRDCIVLDDMISTGGTICQAAGGLKKRGARRVIACATHGVFSGNVFEELEKAPIDEVTVTNTLPLRSDDVPAKIRVLDISKLLSKAILNIHHEESVSSLFI
ncbi:MAG: ribose-phosphate diphosphokinase [Candidatus Krumholzibacteriia bacterium]